MTHKSYIWAIIGIVIVAAIMVLSSPETENMPTHEEEIFCPADVRQCSDGSFVAREAPSCSFAACPEGTTLLEEDSAIIPE